MLEPLVITDISQIRDLASEMKIYAPEDDVPSSYSKNEEDLAELDSVASKIIEENKVDEYFFIRCIVISGLVLSLVLTKCSLEDWDWRFSVGKVFPDQKIPDEVLETVLDEFFDQWAETDNPGIMPNVRFFIGS